MQRTSKPSQPFTHITVNLGIALVFSLIAGAGYVGCTLPNGTLTKPFEAWNGRNSPQRLQYDLVNDFYALPREGKAKKTPWTDTYWPSNKGGIANRWNAGPGDDDSFFYPLHTEEAIRGMSLNELKALSPAEKYDVYMGRFDFPTVGVERVRTKPGDSSWEGICHGWAGAAINFAEPGPVTLKSAQGIEVPFGSSDIKALLSYYQGEAANPPAATRSIGVKCDVDLSTSPDAAERDECRDTNPGSFHVVIANFIGLRNQPFIMDVTRDQQVWNQPVHTFSSRIVETVAPSANAAVGTVKEVVIETVVIYTQEIQPRWDRALGTPHHSDTKRTYNYRLELNVSDEIIGGVWQTKDRPDFVWSASRPEFGGYFANLAEIYRASATDVRPVGDGE